MEDVVESVWDSNTVLADELSNVSKKLGSVNKDIKSVNNNVDSVKWSTTNY